MGPANRRRDIEERTLEFGVRVVALCCELKRSRSGIGNQLTQLTNAATSIGANLEEAAAGHTKADFIAKCSLSLKEAREALYWLRLIARCRPSSAHNVWPLIDEANQIVAILITIVRNARTSPSRGGTL